MRCADGRAQRGGLRQSIPGVILPLQGTAGPQLLRLPPLPLLLLSFFQGNALSTPCNYPAYPGASYSEKYPTKKAIK